MISVIISTYQRPKQVKKTIKSVMRQTYEDLEIIVVDDHSQDRTEYEVRKLSERDNRIRYFKLDENHGHDGFPKNYGAKQAKGEYITFLDDDDTYRPEAISILYKYINHTKADVVYGDYMNHFPNRKPEPGWSLSFQPALLQKMNYIAMSVVMLKKSSFVKIGGFDEEIPKFKDWNLWLRIFKNGGRFLHIPIIITDVTQGGSSLSTDIDIEYDAQGNYLPTFFNPADCLIYPEKTCLGPAKPLKVAVFTLTMDRLDYTKQMYKGLKEAGYDFDWFVVDQASTDGTKDWLEGKATKVMPCKENVGIGMGWMAAIKMIQDAGDYDIVIKIDNDAKILTPNWLKTVVDIFKRNKKIVLSPYVEGLEATPGGVLRQRPDGQMPYMLINDTVVGYVSNLGGIFFASPMELYDGFMFPPELPGNKDLFLSKYASRIGYNLFYVEEIRLVHIDGTKKQRKKYPQYFKRENYG